MAEKNVHAAYGSREWVALQLTDQVLDADRMQEPNFRLTRKTILDAYVECFQATAGYRPPTTANRDND